MSLTGRITAAWQGFLSGKQPTGLVPDLADYLLNHPFIPNVDFSDYAEAFKKVPIVQQCVRQIQHDAASLPLRVYQVRGEVKTEMPRKLDNLVDVLASANKVRDTGYQLMRDTVGAYLLHGNAAWFLQRPKSRQKPPTGPPQELWTLPWQNWRATPTENRGIIGWEYLRGGAWEPVDAANVIHFRDYNPDDSVLGFSRIEPVRREFEAQFYALCLLRDFFKGGGRVGGVYTAKDIAGLGAEKVKAIQEALFKIRGDRTKNFRDVVIDAAMEYVRQGQTLSEMDLEKNLSLINASIARSIGVPPMRLGIKEGGNAFNDGMAASDAQNYWFGTIGQVTTDLSTVLTERLAPLFGPNLVIEFDLRGVLPVQAAKLAQAKTVKELVGCPVLTVNEGRQIMGEPPIDDPAADELYSAPVPTFGPPPNAEPPNRGNGDVPRPAQDAGPAKDARLSRVQGLEREALRKRKSADLASHEREVQRYFAARFVKQHPLVVAWLSQHKFFTGGKRFKGIAIITEPIPIRLPDDDESMQALVRTLLIRRGESALADIGVELAFNATTARAGDFIRAQSDFVLSNVDDTTIAAIQGELALGVEQGETLAQIIERVDAYFDVCEASRSALIGRTETTRAYNFAANEAYQQTEGVVGAQEWLTARDGLGGRHATEAYAGLDGQTVGLNDKFHLVNAETGDEEWVDYPGDGSPANACNCRCTTIPADINENLRRELNDKAAWAQLLKAPSGNGKVEQAVGVRR